MNKITSHHRPGKQLHIIAQIFEDNPNIWISSIEINTNFCLKWIYNQIIRQKLPLNIGDLLNLNINDLSIKIPGDIQRQLRTFYNLHGHHGIEQTMINGTPHYRFDPNIIHININYEPRNMPSESRNEVLEINNRICESCQQLTDQNIAHLRPCGDHWRSWDKYRGFPNISTIGNCVLLCSTCNNIKSNRSGIHLVRKGKCTMERWKEIEKRITNNGFPPNTEEHNEIQLILTQINMNKELVMDPELKELSEPSTTNLHIYEDEARARTSIKTEPEPENE